MSENTAGRIVSRATSSGIMEWDTDEELERLVLPRIERALGQANSVGVKELAQDLGATPRKIRAVVSSLRARGAPICSNTVDGFWWPQDLPEFQRGIAIYRSQVRRMEEVLRGAEGGARRMFSKQGILL